MMNPQITLMYDSASRPNLVEQSLQTLQRHMKYSGETIWIFHEAELFPDESAKCVHIAKYSGIFDKIVKSKPRGQGMSIGNILKECKTEYFIHFEDDHICLRDIPLDDIVGVMETNHKINQIAFNKRVTVPIVAGWPKKEIKSGNFTLTTSPHWRYTPAIWRMDYIKPRWVDFPNSDNSHWEIQRVLKKNAKEERPDANWIIENLGTYYWGKIGEPAYVKNIGKGLSNRAIGINYERN